MVAFFLHNNKGYGDKCLCMYDTYVHAMASLFFGVYSMHILAIIVEFRHMDNNVFESCNGNDMVSEVLSCSQYLGESI